MSIRRTLQSSRGVISKKVAKEGRERLKEKVYLVIVCYLFIPPFVNIIPSSLLQLSLRLLFLFFLIIIVVI